MNFSFCVCTSIFLQLIEDLFSSSHLPGETPLPLRREDQIGHAFFKERKENYIGRYRRFSSMDDHFLCFFFCCCCYAHCILYITIVVIYGLFVFLYIVFIVHFSQRNGSVGSVGYLPACW